LTAQQVADSAAWYDPHWHYAHDAEIREALDFIVSERFTHHEAGIFDPVRDALLGGGDRFRHLADLSDYARAHRELERCYADREAWNRKAVCNVACSGRFSSDRTVREYADEIWNLKVSPVALEETA
jgi:glycogen phosphorylase